MHWTNSPLRGMSGFNSRAVIAEPLERRMLLSSVITVTTASDSGPGSLRDAIDAANNNTTTLTTIRFKISGSGVHTISLHAGLPTITGEVDIQGATDSSGNPLVELDGTNAGANVSGLTFNRNTPSNTKASTVSGLVIDRFSKDGIDIAGDAPTEVFGCWIGIDSTGKHSGHGNGGDGIFVNTVSCQIGLAGVGPAFVNVISANTSNNIEIGGSGADTTVQNCYLGLNAAGIASLGTSNDDILIGAAFATIGGRRAHQGNVIAGVFNNNGIEVKFGNCDILGNKISTNAAGTVSLFGAGNGIETNGVINVSIGDGTAAGQNLISGVLAEGIAIENNSQAITINRNLIGTDITGDKVLGNISFAVEVSNSTNIVLENCVIGGASQGVHTNTAQVNILNCHIGISADLKHAIPNTEEGVTIFLSSGCLIEGNTIADNGEDGVEVDDPTSVGNHIIQNSIFSNGDLGIDLGGTETPLANHNGNVAGPNHDQNYPDLSSAVEANGVTLIDGTLSSTPNTNFSLEFYANDAADPSGFGEGQTLIGGTGVATDANGNSSFSFPAGPAGFGQFITATAVSAGSGGADSTEGDTSEFSHTIKVAGASITGTVFNDKNGNGKQDSGEGVLSGRTVYVDSNHNGLLDSGSERSGTTNSSGHFRIFGVLAGSNLVRMLGTAGWQQTSPSPKAASQKVSVTALGTTGGVLFGQEKSTAKAATLAIDAGSGSAYIDHSGQSFGPDNLHDDDDTPFPVAGTDDDPLYYFFDTGSKLDYSASVPNGKYTLKLFFVDPTSTAKGQRTQNVIANGATVLKNFDIFAAAGATSTAVTKTASLTITNKTLALEFKGVVGNAIVSAYELIPA